MASDPAERDEIPSVVEIRRDGSAFIISIDGEIEALLGWRAQDLIGLPSSRFIHDEDQASAVMAWMEMLEQPDRAHRWRGRYRRSDGGWAWVETVNTNRLDDPDVGHVVSLMLEIPDGELSVEERLRANEQLLSQLTDALPVGVVQFGSDRTILSTNPRLDAILGVSRSTDIDALFDAVTGSDRQALGQAIDDVLANRPVDDLQVHLDGDDPTICSLSFRPLTSADGTVSGAVATVHDVTDEVRFRRQLEHRASTDELTGCANRQAIVEVLDDVLRAVRRPNGGVSAVFIDLDDFKAINDTEGHQVGDRVLAETANRIRAVLRPTDRVGRLGGDEFLVVCAEVAERGVAEQLAERVRAAVNRDLVVEGRPIAVRASVGLAWTPERQDADDLIATADQAMYEAKRNRSEPGAPTRPMASG